LKDEGEGDDVVQEDDVLLVCWSSRRRERKEEEEEEKREGEDDDASRQLPSPFRFMHLPQAQDGTTYLPTFPYLMSPTNECG
jgi:hypothetical protein